MTEGAAGHASHLGTGVLRKGRASRKHAATLDPTCLRCSGPMTVTVADCSLLPRRFRAVCPACGRTVAVTLTARVLRAGHPHTGTPPPEKTGRRLA